jgi:hypothetical protein
LPLKYHPNTILINQAYISGSMIRENDQDRLDLVHRIQNHLTKKFQVYSGKDSNGREYETIEEMWRYEGFFTDDVEKAPQWYQKSHSYWDKGENVQATIDGMLGGFAVLSERDLAASRIFIDEVIDSIPVLKERIESGNSTRSCECGAGIGRLTKGLMVPLGELCKLLCHVSCIFSSIHSN